jgi:predicted RNA-binding protein
MCLSDAFELVGEEKRPLMSYVSGISVEDGKVTLTDMLGARKTVSGTLKSVDLTRNVILIAAAE